MPTQAPCTLAGPRPAGSTRIGITGHSDLTALSLPVVEAVLREWLTARANPPWVGVSCLASGADQLFAGLVVSLGGQLEVILPARDYRARKVAPGDAVEFDRLLAAAAAVTVLGFDRSSREAYMAASTALLAVVETVVAVWDGHPAPRHGGTADVVAQARRLGLPLSVLWPPGATRRPAPIAVRTTAQIVLVLADLIFPAQRWEIVMYAEHYGADWFTRRLLVELPEGRYPDLSAVTAALGRGAS